MVRATHLDEAEVKALRLALNRLPELNTWDEAALALEFKELLELDLTLDLSFDLSHHGLLASRDRSAHRNLQDPEHG